MVDEFENTVIRFDGDFAQKIKNKIRTNIQGLQGSKQHLEGYNRGRFLLDATKLTGLELKRLQNYIDSLPKDQNGRITNPAYEMIGGDDLRAFIEQETTRLRHQINAMEKNQEELGKTEKQDIKPPKPPSIEQSTGLPRLSLELNENIKRIKQLI